MAEMKALKFRIYPNKEQKDFLLNQFGATRFVYNYFLANRKNEYLNNKKSINYYDDCKLLTSLKSQDGYEWLYNINAQSLQASLRCLEIAYQRFFKNKCKFPRFHQKSNRQCLKIPTGAKVAEDGKLYIRKLKSGIKINLDKRTIPAKQNAVYISMTPSGKYYASFQCETDIEPLPKLNNLVGIDLGIKNLVTTSSGETIDNQNYYRKLESKLKYEQKQLSKKQKGSKNKNKQRIIVAKINEQIANQRNDYLHKVSKKLINENQVIIAETLSVKKMMSNHLLAKSIADAGWGELLRQLEYKASWYGRTFYQIDKFFPSSKTCNNCQFVLDDLSLSIREWMCPSCGHKHDRDINAALNILDKGIKDLSGSGIESDVKQKLVEAPSIEGSMKQDIS